MTTPLEGERVVFVAHFERGFHHMLATAIMTLSAFAAFYEGYAGIESFVVAWAKYFQLWKQSVQEPKDKDKNAPDASKDKEKIMPMTQCGAATTMSQKGSEFPKIIQLESVKKWLKYFFYVKNLTKTDLINLSPFENSPPTEMKNWEMNPKNLLTSVNVVHKVLHELHAAGLTPDDILPPMSATDFCRSSAGPTRSAR
jgi:hypothetical protein